ncbi:MAG: hypothetical protein QM677_08050 [Microbacterium sp.]
MSTPNEAGTPPLTRRQLRELRNTASTPIITPDAEPEEAPVVVAPLARAAEPVAVAEEPPAPQDVDLQAPALTRRAARMQAKLHTASIEVIEPPAASAAADATAEAAEESHPSDAEVPADGESPAAAVAETAEAEATDAAQAEVPDAAPAAPAAAPQGKAADAGDAQAPAVDEPAVDTEIESGAAESTAEDVPVAQDEERAVVASSFGQGVLSGNAAEPELPASFDQLLTRGSAATGAITASNALILTQAPETGALTSPVAATGEVLITGTFALPESLGSTGAAHGSSDGKEADAVLLDGELPAASSPSPISASAAISTIASAEDIIKPPAPEKGSRLMLTLIITAGALALALTGVLIVALVTGAFA